MVTLEYNKIIRYIWFFPQPIKGLFTASNPTIYDNAKRLNFSLMDQENRHGKVIKKADLLRLENRKRKLGKESKGRSRQPTERKLGAVQVFAVKTPVGTTTGSSPRCNFCGYIYSRACWICTNYGEKVHLDNRYRTPTNQRTTVVAKTSGDKACFEWKEVGNLRKSCPRLREQGRG